MPQDLREEVEVEANAKTLTSLYHFHMKTEQDKHAWMRWSFVLNLVY